MRKSEQINELAAALAKAQAEIRGAKESKYNTFFKSAYADLGDVWNAIREPITKNGLSVAQTTEIENGAPIILTILMHASGQWMAGAFPIKAKDDSPQSMGSGTSYARRYALGAMVGAYEGDDDGESAQGRKSDIVPNLDDEPGSYVIRGGQFEGKRLDQIGQHDLNTWVNHWKGKTLSAPHAEAIREASKYLDFVERKPK